MSEWPMAAEAAAFQLLNPTHKEQLRKAYRARGKKDACARTVLEDCCSESEMDDDFLSDALVLPGICDPEAVVDVVPSGPYIPGTALSVKEVLSGMRDPQNGIRIKDRRPRLRKHRKCFLGQEAVDWMVETYPGQAPDRERAVAILDALIDAEIIHHVTDNHRMEDASLLYRFRVDDEVHALNVSLIAQEEGSSVALGDIDTFVSDLRLAISKIYLKYMGPDGRSIDISGLENSEEMAEFEATVTRLQTIDPSQLDEVARKAFFLNLYNILVVHAACIHGYPSGILSRAWFFKTPCYLINGHFVSLNAIEHGFLRANAKPPYARKRILSSDDPRKPLMLPHLDPRIHFALNCGAASCPPIRVFAADNLEMALEVVTEVFCESEVFVISTRDPAAVNVKDADEADDLLARRFPTPDHIVLDDLYQISMSKLFSWFRDDFGGLTETILFAARYSPPTRAALLRALVDAGPEFYSVRFRPYDWKQATMT